jgi:hypothetical protein
MTTEAYKKLAELGAGTKFADPRDPEVIHEITDDTDVLWSVVRAEDPPMHYHLEANFGSCEEINIIEAPNRLDALKKDLKAVMEKHEVSIECGIVLGGVDISEGDVLAVYKDGKKEVLVPNSIHQCDIN